MFNVTGGEVVIILVVALIVLGPEKLPEMIRKVGKAYGEFKRMTQGFQSEINDVFGEPIKEFRDTVETARTSFTDAGAQPLAEMRETAKAARSLFNLGATATGDDDDSAAAATSGPKPSDPAPNAPKMRWAPPVEAYRSDELAAPEMVHRNGDAAVPVRAEAANRWSPPGPAGC